MDKIIKSLKKEEHKSTVKKVFESNQEHVLRFWHELDEIMQENHLNILKDVDFELLEKLRRKHLDPDMDRRHRAISPVNAEKGNEKAKGLGEAAIKAGEVAVLLVAGGQGSRLGFVGPKGMFPITPIKGRTLFQLFSEKLRALSKRHGIHIPWYIMTSKENHDVTKQYFEQNSLYDDIFFFRQGVIPAIDSHGKLILKSKHEIFTNPDGHGGTLLALSISGAIKDMKKKGIKYVFYFQVDNPLVVIADPMLIGMHIQKNAEMSAKAVKKAYPEEKVGVFGLIDGRIGVIEYMDLTDEEMHAMDDGKLKYNSGNIAIHVFNVDFIERLNRQGLKLPHHKSVKRIKTHDSELDGIKFETFIFDAFQEAKGYAVLEVERVLEFAPTKNSSGKDSPEEARMMQTEMFAGWLEEAGVKIPRKDGKADGKIEISPQYALDKEEFVSKYRDKPRLKGGFELYIG